MNKQNIIPPKLATRLLHAFLRTDLAEEVEGDLEEKFYQTVQSKSLFRAKLNYWYEVLNYIRPFAIRKSKSMHLNQFDMFKNYFKISTRSLMKQRLYSLINIGGLTLGLTCFLIILLYVQHEFSYNNFYPDADRIYRVYQKQTGNLFLGTDYFAVTPAQLASVMREEIPEVAHATSIEQTSGLLAVDDQNFWETGMAGDDQFFLVLSMPFISGDPKTALADSKSIVLTRTLAKTIFGDKDPIGQTIRYQEEDGFHVTAVIEDAPLNSSLQYSFVVNILYNRNYIESLERIGWNNNSFHTFFKLVDGAPQSAVDEKFPALLKKYQLPKDYAEYSFTDEYFSQPISELYFHPNINFDIGIKGNRDSIYLFSIVAFIVLLLACVNYTNLAVARSMKRAREVGLRKVVGAFRRQLIIQFMGESILISLLSLLLAVALTYLTLPFFARMVERPIEINFLSNAISLPALLLLVLIVGFLSGSYPALFMSSLKPVDVLKAKADVKVSGFSLQRSLIILQFAASITLVITSFVIYRQLSFMQKKELGYNKSNVVTIRLRDRSLRDKFQILSTELAQNPTIVASTLSSHLPTNITSSTMISKPGESTKRELAIYQCTVEYGFLDVFGINLSAGRNFNKNSSTDLESFLINETAAKALGWTPQEAVGKQIEYDGPKTIIGVVKDFHMYSMHLPILPLMIRGSGNRGSYISIKIAPNNIPETLAFIEKTFKANSPYPFDYQFLDENFNQLYANEMKLGEIFGFFTVVSILIASLGLFGLAAFMCSLRTKEIGIRKVLGASVNGIVLLISKDFVKLVLIAFVVAVPTGWYISHQWLQDFAYKVSIEWWIFAVAGMLVCVIATLSVGYQSLKASLMNPAETLKSE